MYKKKNQYLLFLYLSLLHNYAQESNEQQEKNDGTARREKKKRLNWTGLDYVASERASEDEIENRGDIQLERDEKRSEGRRVKSGSRRVREGRRTDKEREKLRRACRYNGGRRERERGRGRKEEKDKRACMYAR